MSEEKPRPKVEWQQNVQTFRDEETGIVVQVSKLALFRPIYSYAIYGTAKDGRTVRNVKAQVSVEDGVVSTRTLAVISSLLTQAERWVTLDAQTRENEIAERDEQRASRSKPPGLSQFTKGSKTERERASGKTFRHEANVTAKAEKNRADCNAKSH